MRCDVSVIVPTFNEETDIGTCLEAIRAQKTRFSYEIIVSDARSTDATCDIASRFADKIIITTKMGIGTGRNAGTDVAKGEHLLFVDADTVLPEFYIEEAQKKFADESLLAFSGMFKFSPRTKRGIIAEQVMDAYYRVNAKAGKAIMLGFNTNVRRLAFERTGGYRDIPIEDVEFGMRVRALGKTKYFPDLFVYTSSRRLKKMGLLGTAIYYIKLDLKLRHPEFAKFTTIDDYHPVRLPSFKVGAYEEMTFSSKTNAYISRKLSELDGIMKEFNITRLQMRGKVKSTVKSLSYLSLAPHNPEEFVDKAIELLKERYRKLR